MIIAKTPVMITQPDYPTHPDYPKIAIENERAIGKHKHLLELYHTMLGEQAAGLTSSILVSQYDVDRAMSYVVLCYDAESYLWSLHLGKTCMCDGDKDDPCRLCFLKSRYELWLEERE